MMFCAIWERTARTSWETKVRRSGSGINRYSDMLVWVPRGGYRPKIGQGVELLN